MSPTFTSTSPPGATCAPVHAPPAPAPFTPTPPPAVNAAESPAPLTCPHCGGSGILRMGDQQFRTCLECLGQGQLPPTVQQELRFPPHAVRASASHAR
jgi:hypothetical protein